MNSLRLQGGLTVLNSFSKSLLCSFVRRPVLTSTPTKILQSAPVSSQMASSKQRNNHHSFCFCLFWNSASTHVRNRWPMLDAKLHGDFQFLRIIYYAALWSLRRMSCARRNETTRLFRPLAIRLHTFQMVYQWVTPSSKLNTLMCARLTKVISWVRVFLFLSFFSSLFWMLE